MECIWCVRCEKIERFIVVRTCALITRVQLALDRTSCNNGTVRNSPKHELGVQGAVRGAFVARNSDATLLHNFVH
jgi:hypothetical protein